MSTGCYAEASLASGLGKEVVAYSPKEDIEKYQQQNKSTPLDRVWPMSVRLLPDEGHFWKEVDAAVMKVQRRRATCTSPIEA